VRKLLLACLVALIVQLVVGHNIKHVVVLMLENRSFDHILGYLKGNNTKIEGLTGKEFNRYNSKDPNSKAIFVNPDAAYIDPDPGHSILATRDQMFGIGGNPNAAVAPMCGFVEQAESLLKGMGQSVMSAFNFHSVPVISTLAQEFVVFDHWHSSVPGPTQVNRMFATSGTSYGACNNEDWAQIIPGYPQKSIFKALDEVNKTWNVYFHDLPSTLFLKDTRSMSSLSKLRFFDKFYEDAANGTLPAFSWLEPRYFEMFGIPANDQHPSHDVSEGEILIKKVYEAVRNGPGWNNTALLVTYDEHGGFYDHFPTPTNGVPNPDGRECPSKFNFDFTRLGVRIPTILISPWVEKGVVEHTPAGPTPTSQYDHTSTLASVKQLFNTTGFLTKRDAWAGTWTHLLSRTTPRTNAPTSLPTPPTLRKLPLTGTLPLTDLHYDFLQLAQALNGEMPMKRGTVTDNLFMEAQGAEYVNQVMSRLINQPIPLRPDHGYTEENLGIKQN